MANESVKSDITGKVWKIVSSIGDSVEEDTPIIIIESMKMEIPVLAPCGGKISKLLVAEGDDVAEGQEVAVVET
jgi:acetyl-CoA carboxylase biotin carboxyl carrier protein